MNCFSQPPSARLIQLVIICCLVLGTSALTATASHDGAAPAVRLGREFKLRPGQQLSLKGTKLRIKFAAVENDSRCPSDVTCVWAGNAAVRFRVSSGRDSKTMTLNTGGGSSMPDEDHFRGYKLKLVGLSPYPRSDRPIAALDYTATLLISKNK